jgi:branched-chain amino acid transport system permease protein
MSTVLGFSVFGVDWQFVKPFIVIGLAFGGVYALSGVGLVVLYRATGVLNVAFGAIGASGALIAYYLLNHTSCPDWLAFSVCVAFGGVVNLAYGMIFGPAFARRDPLTKMMGTLGLALVLLGLMACANRRSLRASCLCRARSTLPIWATVSPHRSFSPVLACHHRA